MDTDYEDVELDDRGNPPREISECSDCGVHPEISPIDGSMQVFHYDNCFFMNPENFIRAA